MTLAVLKLLLLAAAWPGATRGRIRAPGDPGPWPRVALAWGPIQRRAGQPPESVGSQVLGWESDISKYHHKRRERAGRKNDQFCMTHFF